MRLVLSAILLLFTACGLAENPRDEENKFIYITFSDPAFEKYCLEAFDTNHDGRLSRYEAQRARNMTCPGLGIASMAQVSEFTNLRTLDCSDNDLTGLDLRACADLRTVNCSHNRLSSLDLRGLRGLVTLDCSVNDLARLDLTSVASLSTLDCRTNDLRTLDVRPCAADLRADVRDNPRLTTVYCRSSQGVEFNGATDVIRD